MLTATVQSLSNFSLLQWPFLMTVHISLSPLQVENSNFELNPKSYVPILNKLEKYGLCYLELKNVSA